MAFSVCLFLSCKWRLFNQLVWRECCGDGDGNDSNNNNTKPNDNGYDDIIMVTAIMVGTTGATLITAASRTALTRTTATSAATMMGISVV